MTMGMMHEGYFVGRKELISWIQQYFDPGFNKIEDLASGVVYCKIINSIYPGVVPMAKVKQSARTEVDFIDNFKILQTAFGKKKIDRFIEVNKMTKRSFQHNMEFLQFMKCYWDMHAAGAAGGGAPEPVFQEAAANEQQQQPPPPKPKAPPKPPQRKEAPSAVKPAVLPAPPAAVQDEELIAEVSELKLSVENLERERDFYYAKLRQVEVLCQTHEDANVPFLQEVLDILYKTDDNDEFVHPDQQEPIPA